MADAMLAGYDPIKYKIMSRDNWNNIAFDYDSGWAGKAVGPFKSTAELVKAANIESGDIVLDLACGTGAVSKEIMGRLRNTGILVGIDFSRAALSIARSNVPLGDFIEMDAENIGFATKFDKILCQYALMFFPNAERVLKELRTLLKVGGLLAVAVHGTSNGVPYFSTIMEPILRHIPDIRPKQAPTVHRFGIKEDLHNAIASAGFSEVSIIEYNFQYNAGTFDKYWQDYMYTTAASLRSKIECKDKQIVSAIKLEAEKEVQQFVKDGEIHFPWQVLIATAKVSDR